jgi:hypothetical protein
MKELKILSLTLFACCTLLFMVWPRNDASAMKPAERLGIEITSDTSDKPLYIPVALTTEKSMVAYVPVRDGNDITAVRIEPVMQQGKVKFSAFAISGDYETNKSCADVHKLPARLIETHLASEGDLVSVQDSLSATPWRVKIKVGKLRPPMVIGSQSRAAHSKMYAFQDPVFEVEPGPCGCATCGTKNPLWCCPARGQCIGCSNCGTICCPNG